MMQRGVTTGTHSCVRCLCLSLVGLMTTLCRAVLEPRPVVPYVAHYPPRSDVGPATAAAAASISTGFRG